MEKRFPRWKAVTFILFLLLVSTGGLAGAQAPSSRVEGRGSQDVVRLPSFEKNNPFTLDKALQERKSVRSFDPDRKLSLVELSRLLWAACGVNRPSGGRTVPSARAQYPVDVLAALPDGVYLYEPAGHSLKKVIKEDLRPAIPVQAPFQQASMIVLYVINKDKTSNIEWADLEIGCIGQNIYLEAAALGLGSRIFAGVAKDPVSKALGLKENQILRIAQAVGAAK